MVANRQEPVNRTTPASEPRVVGEGRGAARSVDRGDLLTELIDEVFRLNGAFLEAGNALASAVGLTAAQWQVLGYLRDRSVSVATLARARGLSRQSVQQTANLLIERGFLQKRDDPRDRRAPLLQVTSRALDALGRLEPERRRWASSTAEVVPATSIESAIAALRAIRAATR